MPRILETLANAFPLWVLAACSLALVRPELFTWFGDAAIVVGLGVIMLGMGLTLSLDDFSRVASQPSAVAAGASAAGASVTASSPESPENVTYTPAKARTTAARAP